MRNRERDEAVVRTFVVQEKSHYLDISLQAGNAQRRETFEVVPVERGGQERRIFQNGLARIEVTVRTDRAQSTNKN